jgi:hypothetical protein
MIPYRQRRCRAFLATCVICAHSQCQEIDAELRARVRSRTIADAYGVPLQGLAQAAGAVAVPLRPGAGGGAFWGLWPRSGAQTARLRGAHLRRNPVRVPSGLRRR